MYVYIWKRPDGTPFYVGMTKNIGRSNPLNSGGRGWLCKQTLQEIGAANVVVELHIAETLEKAQDLERKLILEFGRVQLGNGTLSNLRPGGEGPKSLSDETRKLRSEFMKKNNPAFKPEVREKIKIRIEMPDIKQKFLGENNPAKRPEVKQKLKDKWQDPEYQERQRQSRIGIKRHTDEHKAALRNKLLDPTNPMREYHKTLNSDPAIKEKRAASLKSPEVRAKISAGLKAKWAERKAMSSA